MSLIQTQGHSRIERHDGRTTTISPRTSSSPHEQLHRCHRRVKASTTYRPSNQVLLCRFRFVCTIPPRCFFLGCGRCRPRRRGSGAILGCTVRCVQGRHTRSRKPLLQRVPVGQLHFRSARSLPYVSLTGDDYRNTTTQTFSSPSLTV